MAGEISHFVKTKVYPNLNAVLSNLFDTLHPQDRGDHYLIDCADCGKPGSATYKAKGSEVKCESCGKRLSVWDVVAKAKNLNNSRSVLHVLSDASGQRPPERNKNPSSETNIANSPSSERIFETNLFNILRDNLSHSDLALRHLIEERSWSQEEIKLAPIGYYPSVRIVADKLQQCGADLNVAKAWGVLDAKFEQLIVGLWRQPDKTSKLWGTGFGATTQSGTIFQDGLVTTVPCFYFTKGYKPTDTVLLVQEPLASARLLANGIRSAALSSIHITTEQAPFLSRQLADFIQWAMPDGTSRMAAERSILRINPLGIHLKILESPEGWGDPEQSISRAGIDSVRSALNNTTHAGTYLAARLASQLERLDFSKTQTKGRLWRRCLQGASLNEFVAELARRGVVVGDDTAEACRTLAALIDSGVPVKEATNLIGSRTGIRISLYTESIAPNHDENERIVE